MSETGNDLVDRLHCEALSRRPSSASAAAPLTIHYTELPEAGPESSLQREWNTYRREAERLLAEGHTGRHALIKGEAIVGLWESDAEAMRAGYEKFLGQAFLVHQVQEREPVLHSVSVLSCHDTRTQFGQAS